MAFHMKENLTNPLAASRAQKVLAGIVAFAVPIWGARGTLEA